jgi:hypothetical protein
MASTPDESKFHNTISSAMWLFIRILGKQENKWINFKTKMAKKKF